MPRIYLTHSFDAGHRIVGHKGKCARLHGHTYNVEVNIIGELVDPGFVIDFGDVKEEIDKWDHRTLLWDQDPLMVQDPSSDNIQHTQKWTLDGEHVIRVAFNPTAENMVKDLAERLISLVGPPVRVVEVTLWETLKASATHSVTRVPA